VVVTTPGEAGLDDLGSGTGTSNVFLFVGVSIFFTELRMPCFPFGLLLSPPVAVSTASRQFAAVVSTSPVAVAAVDDELDEWGATHSSTPVASVAVGETFPAVALFGLFPAKGDLKAVRIDFLEGVNDFKGVFDAPRGVAGPRATRGDAATLSTS